MKRNHGLILLIIFTIIFFAGCGKKFEESYMEYDEQKEMYTIIPKASEDKENLDLSRIDKNVPDELYIAKFGFNEIKSHLSHGAHIGEDKEQIPYITFVDKENKGHIIFQRDDSVGIEDIPRVVADENILAKEFSDINDENIEEYLNLFEYDTHAFVVSNGDKEKLKIDELTPLKYEVKADSENTGRVTIYTLEGKECYVKITEEGVKEFGHESYDLQKILDGENPESKSFFQDKINKLIKSNGLDKYKLIDYKLGKVSEKDTFDYVILVSKEGSREGNIYVISGNTGEIIASREVKVGDAVVNLELKKLLDTNSLGDRKVIDYLTRDRGPVVPEEFLYSCEEGELIDICEDIKRVPDPKVDKDSGRFYYDFEDLNKIISIQLKDEVLGEIMRKAQKGQKLDDLIQYSEFDIQDNKGELTIVTHMTCYSNGKSEFGQMKRIFQWDEDGWKLIDVDFDFDEYLEQFGGKCMIVNTVTDAEVNDLFKNGSWVLKEEDIDKVFTMTKERILELYENPKITKDDAVTCDNIEYGFGCNYRYSWGPNSIGFLGENHDIAGIKIGMNMDQVKEVIKNSLENKKTIEGKSEEGPYIMTLIGGKYQAKLQFVSGKLEYINLGET